MRGSSRFDLPDREGVEQRLRQAVHRLHPELQVDDLEMAHLVDVVTNHALLLNDLYSTRRLDQILGQDPATVLHGIAEMLRREEGLPPESILQVRRIPDDVRVVGDKCLYDVGLFGRQRYQGLDLRQLGVRCYNLASEILEHLADDRRLREYFRQNRLGPMRIEDEVIFLRQCAERFTVYSDLLKNLHLYDPTGPAEGPASLVMPGLPGPGTATPPFPRPGWLPPDEGEPAAAEDVSGETAAEPPGGEAAPGEALRYAARHQEHAVPGADRLPRRDLLSLYERLVLFANLDVPALKAELERTVVDQPEAVAALCDELSLYATGTQSLSRPASFFLVGPTGVGKNHLVESFARALEKHWGIEVPMLLIEGPQYTYPSDINELKGATRGFIRSDEDGILTEFYHRASGAPLSILLVDEVEKSHPQLRKFFLGLMDRGTTMDNRGETLWFVNTLFFYTSNIGYSRLQTETAPIGFGGSEAREEIRHREVVNDLKKTLSPEFVNRVSVIRFRPLGLASVERIFDLELEKLAARYREVQGIDLTVTPEARAELIRQGHSPEYGARPLGRLVNQVCNVEVSKRLKRDEHRDADQTADLLAWLREAREGKRPLDPAAVDRVLDLARAQVGYVRLEIGWDGAAFLYTPGGRSS